MPNKPLPLTPARSVFPPISLSNVPAGYTSPDVIDRRNGQVPTLGDKLRDLVIKVRTDYNDSFPQPIDSPVPGFSYPPKLMK